MVTWILSKWSWKSFAVGLGAALFGGTIARPVLVKVVKAGMEAGEAATHTFHQARVELDNIRHEAMQQRSFDNNAGNSELLAELRKLREEIASIKRSQ
jgi:glucosamine 6-phosphate synthetase-like amidotransferase/phosphosugar isomerase protein